MKTAMKKLLLPLTIAGLVLFSAAVGLWSWLIISAAIGVLAWLLLDLWNGVTADGTPSTASRTRRTATRVKAGLAVKAPTSAKPKTQVRRHPYLHKHELGRLASGRR